MRWFFGTFAVVTAVLFLSFVAWIATRVMHADAANYVVGQIMIYDLCAVAVILAYSGFVGAWHLWEKLTGRMEAEAEEDAAKAASHPPGERRSVSSAPPRSPTPVGAAPARGVRDPTERASFRVSRRCSAHIGRGAAGRPVSTRSCVWVAHLTHVGPEPHCPT